MKPRIEITVDGQAVAGAFYERLVNCSVVDNDGDEADTFSMELNDGPPNFLELPKTGGTVDIRIGYGSLRSVGTFTIDKVTPRCLPFKISISGKSADLRNGKLKEKQERSWSDKAVGDIVQEVANESGLSASVDPEIAQHKYPWLAQTDESNIHFLRRIANRHNALFAVKEGCIVFAKRGSGQSASGAFVGSVVVTPDVIQHNTCTFEVNDRTKYKKVVAYYQDKDKAQRVEIEADSDEDGDSVYRIPEPFANVEEADKAAQSKAKDLKRGEGSASVTVIGDTAIVAGAPLLFQGVRPGLDGVPYVIDKVTHTFSKSGFLTAISAKLYDGKSGGGKTPKSGETAQTGQAANDNTPDTVAPDAPANAPATPNDWYSQRRYGSTDAN